MSSISPRKALRVLLYVLLIVLTVVNIALLLADTRRDTDGVFIDGVKQNCTVERTPGKNIWECSPAVST